MFQEDRLSTYPIVSPIIGGRATLGNVNLDLVEGELLTDYENGGIAIGDASEGLLYQIWSGDCDGTDINLIDATGNRTLVYTGTDISAFSFTFDQNMRVNLAFIEGGEGKLYWYDSTISDFITTNYGSTYTNTRVFLDDKRLSQTGNSDIIFTYVRREVDDSFLCFRMQRDRFLTEYVLRSDMSTYSIENFGMGRNLRLQWVLVDLVDTDITIEPYEDCETCPTFDVEDPYEIGGL